MYSFNSQNLNASFIAFMQSFIRESDLHKVAQYIESINSKIENEFLFTVNEQQLNDALRQFVTGNVDEILEMKIACHKNWFRLHCVFFAQGIYGKVAANYDLVHIQLDKHRQRLVFAQQNDTEILELHATSYPTKLAIAAGIPYIKKFTNMDPLHFLLSKFKLATIKDNVVYIDIGRWLRNDRWIMSQLQKVQVNYAFVAPEQLVLKTNINPKDIIPALNKTQVISEKDNPLSKASKKDETSTQEATETLNKQPEPQSAQPVTVHTEITDTKS